MADPRYKVRRQAYFKQGITTASTLNVSGAVNFDNTLTVDGATTQTGKITAAVGIDTTSGSVSTFSGGLTAASTTTVSGCLISGTGGTPIAGILCGSAAFTLAVSASGASAACFPVPGLTTAHKIFLSSGSLAGCATAVCPYCKTGTTPCLVFTVISPENVSGTSTLFYLAVLDK